MVAAVIVVRQLALRVNRAAELAAPHDQRLVEHPPLFEVANKRGGRLVDALALPAKVVGAGSRADPSRDGTAA